MNRASGIYGLEGHFKFCAKHQNHVNSIIKVYDMNGCYHISLFIGKEIVYVQFKKGFKYSFLTSPPLHFLKNSLLKSTPLFLIIYFYIFLFDLNGYYILKRINPDQNIHFLHVETNTYIIYSMRCGSSLISNFKGLEN